MEDAARRRAAHTDARTHSHHRAQHVERLGHAVDDRVAAPDDAIAVKDEAVDLVDERALVGGVGLARCGGQAAACVRCVRRPRDC